MTSSEVPGRRRKRSGVLRLVIGLLLGAGFLVAGPLAPATSADGTASGIADPGSGRPYLGAALEWSEDDAAGFADRLQATPALFAHDVSLPVTDGEKAYIRQFLSQSAQAGSYALLNVRPTVPLGQVTAVAATDFAAQVKQLTDKFPGRVFIDFAPDMNTGWVDWGQQPHAYVQAFRSVANAFAAQSGKDATQSRPVMVWQPFAGKDYPFTKNRNAPAPGSPDFGALDTNHDGVWDSGDNPYSPFYPGDDVVDWVGLSAYHDDTGGAAAVNSLPRSDELAGMLDGAPSSGGSGTGASRTDFYSSYASGRGKPLLLQTAAYYSPTAGGPSEKDIKSSWWSQILSTASSARFGKIGAVVWDERTESRGVGNVSIDWRIAGNPAIAGAAGADVRKSTTFTTAPVTKKVQQSSPSAPNTLSGPAAWLAMLAALAAAVGLWLLPQRVRAVRGWSYDDDSARDSRVDLLRGVAIVFVVVDHLGLNSIFQLFTQEAIGFVSGAELFVLLSGLVLGMVYGPRAKDRLGEVVGRTSRRAGKLYTTALVVTAAVFVISLVPQINADTLTTFTDQGTGAAGHDAAGRTYDLYAGMRGLLQFPVPPAVIPSVLLLQFGPWQFNVMGLYVVMLLLSPLVLLAVARGKAAWVLLATFALYVVGSVFRFRILPSQFEDSFPLLVWQVLFIVGLVAGTYRQRIVAWLTTHRWVVAVCVGITLVFAIASWANPYLPNQLDYRLALLPDATYRGLYDQYFDRTFLGPGRLLNVLTLVVTVFALLTVYWKPVERTVGRLLVPLGRATLYVFIVHVALIAVVANIPWLQSGNMLVNSLAYVVILALLWVMVRKRFLFNIIPT